MKKDLYTTLGVHKSASKEAIKRAYRKGAKRNHPDAGGSVVKWHALQEAYDTLCDDGARARYDETGEVGGKPQSLRDKAVADLARLFVLLAESMDTEHCNLVDEATREVTKTHTGLTRRVNTLKAKSENLRGAAARFTVNDSATENFPAIILNNQADLLESQATATEEGLRVISEALKILKEFSYRTEAGSETPSPFQWGSFEIFSNRK